MPPDIQSTDINENPDVIAAKEFAKRERKEISAEISQEVAKQQAAFAELREEIQNGTLTFGNSIFELAVPAAQAGENTTDDDLKIKDKYEQKLEDAEREVDRLKKKLKKAKAKAAKSAEKAKKSRKKAKDYLRGLYAKGYTRDRIMTEHREAGLSKRGTEFLISVLDEIAEEDRKK